MTETRTPTATKSSKSRSPSQARAAAQAQATAASRSAATKPAAAAPAAPPEPAPPAKASKASKAPKAPKPKKPKLVRDSYTIPKDEYEAIALLKQRCKPLARSVKKSELLRAGLRALAAMSDKALHAAVLAVPPLKTGRPPKG